MSQTTFRFKFKKELLNNIREFSKLHSNDDCDEFIYEFKIWVRNNKQLINYETIRLGNLGFKGDIEKKIYKSARYYFKNKSKKQYTIQINTITNNNITSKTTTYIPRNKSFFKTLETYISNNPIKASVLYKKFINETEPLIQREIYSEKIRLSNYQLSETEILKKIQKAFNNAYNKIKKQRQQRQHN